MINIDFLEYLIEFSKTENLTHASKVLHISQSALTRAMQKIEEYVSVPIFDRTKNKITLNETGLELVKNATNVLNAMNEMKENTITFYNKTTNISIGVSAPGPMIKYGNLFFSLFPNKSIVSKIESNDELLSKLKNNLYDFVFLSEAVEDEELLCKFAFREELYVSLPKTHFLATINRPITFSEIDGQSFLVSSSLGLWDDIVKDKLPKSKFFPQSYDNLNEIVNASNIPSFATNITIETKNPNRITLPISDEEAKVNFYFASKNKDKKKFKKVLNMINNS